MNLNKRQVPWCLLIWLVTAFLVSVFIRENSGVKIIAGAVGSISLAATWWGFHQTQYPLRQIILHRFVFAAVFVGLVWYNLPLKAVFYVSRPAFEQAASQLLKSGEVKTPFWIGPFRIRYAGVKNSVPYLGTNKGEWEIEGFVRHPEGEGFNPWSFKKLDRNWAYVSED